MVAPALSRSDEKLLIIHYLIGQPIAAISRDFGIHRATIHRILERNHIITDRKAAT